jgi:hypothetical protein
VVGVVDDGTGDGVDEVDADGRIEHALVGRGDEGACRRRGDLLHACVTQTSARDIISRARGQWWPVVRRVGECIRPRGSC